MSTSVQPQQPTGTGTPTSPSSGAPSGTPTEAPVSTSPTAPSTPIEYRYPDDPSIPSYARGKTSGELLNITQGLYGQFQQYVQTGQVPNQPQNQSPQGTWGNATQNPPQSFQNAPQPTQPYQVDPDAPMTMRDLERLAPALLQGQQQRTDAAINLAASANLDRLKTNRPDLFAKYGPEVYGYLSRLPKDQWTLDNLDEVGNIVQGKHYRELAREEAQRLAVAPDAGVIRSSGAAPNPAVQVGNASSPISEKIPAEYAQRMAALGIDNRALDEFCQRERMTREQFLNQFGTTAITEHGARANLERSSNNPNSPLR